MIQADNPAQASPPQPPAWVAEQIAFIIARCLRPDGLLGTELDGELNLVNAKPLVCDLGDVLPLLLHFGEEEFCREQIRLAQGFLDGGLYKEDGQIRLFLNHDWLLGLVELGRELEDRAMIDMAIEAVDTFERRFFCDDFLTNLPLQATSPRSWPGPASPFNLGYVELWLALREVTGDDRYLGLCRRLTARWIETADFREHGIFSRLHATRPLWLNVPLQALARARAFLFKDNTNAVWSLLDLAKCDPGEPLWEDALAKWLEGFERHFANDGLPWLHLKRDFQGADRSLNGAFAAIDLLTDIHDHTQWAEAERLARLVADRWLEQRWKNGLFPAAMGQAHNHLDANTDMAVALMKLAGSTGQTRYETAALETRDALLAYHGGPDGFRLAVAEDGRPVSERRIVKYQGLVLKLALLPDSAEALARDEAILRLLRDR
ncbi:hypothetical protein [Oceanicaulis alexandrii]|uniref:hypothetical protein n=1 Tax=Oceanicaulis alexandrii TaxID=153233 RepID=UPI0023530026|nr:hypothetical protein [Oceanicaulis alexandrii]